MQRIEKIKPFRKVSYGPHIVAVHFFVLIATIAIAIGFSNEVLSILFEEIKAIPRRDHIQATGGKDESWHDVTFADNSQALIIAHSGIGDAC